MIRESTAKTPILARRLIGPNACRGFHLVPWLFCLVSMPSLRIFCLLILSGLVWAPAVGAESPDAKSAQPLPVRGVVRPSAQAIISTDLTARVARVGFREGAQFRMGDVLVAFDCRRHKAELASAEAQNREMLVAFDSALFLEKRNAGSRQDVEIARARVTGPLPRRNSYAPGSINARSPHPLTAASPN